MSSVVLPYAPSETLGFIPERLERLTAIMARQVEEKKAPGVSMLIARHGRIAYRELVGSLRPGGPAMTDDAIFRIYSMTKPIVSVAAMMLVEEGRLLITDPVSKYIPAFANAKVGVVSGDKLDLAPLKRPITVQDLMRHTSGLTYGFTGVSPVQKLIKAANVVNSNRSLAENIDAMAALPLMHQPGEVWEYSVSTDVLGRVIEVIEGASLGEVLQQRLFGPLGMVDTAFFTPEFETRSARRSVLVRLHDLRRGRFMQLDSAAEIRVRRRWAGVDARRLYKLRRHAQRRRRDRRRTHSQSSHARLHGQRSPRRRGE